MKQFKKILVGVDLSWGDRLVSEELSPPNAEAVRQALWLAKINSASVSFVFTLELSAKAQELISQSSAGEATVVSEAKDRLAVLVEEARKEGVAAESQVIVGKTWLELIRQVLRNEHDLVIVGTRHSGPLKGFLLGSTGIKLVRNCPCPVWVTQPPTGQFFDSLLVAHDLRPVGDLAMELGCCMAELQNAKLHVVHAAEFPKFDSYFAESDSAEQKQKYREDADRHIQSQVAAANLPRPADVHFSADAADAAILNCIQQHAVDLLVMGTVGRTGISGFITGNTAERLLPQIPCSLLAVKPPGFQSPVTLN